MGIEEHISKGIWRQKRQEALATVICVIIASVGWIAFLLYLCSLTAKH